jgi:hypothetical protein
MFALRGSQGARQVRKIRVGIGIVILVRFSHVAPRPQHPLCRDATGLDRASHATKKKSFQKAGSATGSSGEQFAEMAGLSVGIFQVRRQWDGLVVPVAREFNAHRSQERFFRFGVKGLFEVFARASHNVPNEWVMVASEGDGQSLHPFAISWT